MILWMRGMPCAFPLCLERLLHLTCTCRDVKTFATDTLPAPPLVALPGPSKDPGCTLVLSLVIVYKTPRQNTTQPPLHKQPGVSHPS